MSKKILVLGGSGYVGRGLLDRVGTDRVLGTYFQNSFPGGFFFDPERRTVSDLIKEQGDFSHALILVKGRGPIDDFAADKEASFRVNVTRIVSIIDQLFEQDIKPIFVSSDAVFDGEKGGYTEEDLPNPQMVYGQYKLAIERYLQSSGRDHAILRLSKVYGVTRGDQTLFTQWLDALEKQVPLRLAWDQKLSPIFIEDAVDALLATVECNVSGLFHVCGPAAFSRVEMFHMLLNMLKEKFGDIRETPVQISRINDLCFREKRPIDCSMNPQKFVNTVGLSLQTVASSCRTVVDSLDSWPPSTASSVM